MRSAVDPHETHLVVARRFRISGVQQGHAGTPVGQRIPGRGDGDGCVPVVPPWPWVILAASPAWSPAARRRRG